MATIPKRKKGIERTLQSVEELARNAPDAAGGKKSRRLLVLVGVMLVAAVALLLLTPYQIKPVLGAGQVEAHIVLFSFLAVVAFSLLGLNRVTVVFLLALAVVTELVQRVADTGHRGELSDIVINLGGIAAGAAFVAGFNRLVPAKAESLAAGLSALGLLGLIGLMVVSHPEFNRWNSCRNLATETAADPFGLEKGPVLLHQAGHETLAGGLETASDLPVAADEVAGPLCAAINAGEFTVVLELTSDDLAQEGPTRIVSFSTSTDPKDQNFHVGQQGQALSVRFRTSPTNGVIWEQIDGVFVSNDPMTIVVAHRDQVVGVFVDGIPRDSFAVPYGAMSYWDQSFPFLVGDELSGDRAFIGTIKTAAFYDRSLTETEIMSINSADGS